MAFAWHPEHVEFLTECVVDKLSASQTVVRFRHRFDV